MSCVGLYADVGVSRKHTRLKNVPKGLKGLLEAYQRHKKRFVKNFVFNASAHSANFGEKIAKKKICLRLTFQPQKNPVLHCSWSRFTLTQLHMTRFSFQVPFFTFQFWRQIVRDKKLKFEAQLSLIGGTMGLLTGFSIISAVEIVYFLIKLLVKGILAKTKTKE